MAAPIVEAVTAATRAAQLCVMCLAREAAAAPLRIIGAIAMIGRDTTITTETGSCDGCQQTTVVYRIR